MAETDGSAARSEIRLPLLRSPDLRQLSVLCFAIAAGDVMLWACLRVFGMPTWAGLIIAGTGILTTMWLLARSLPGLTSGTEDGIRIHAARVAAGPWAAVLAVFAGGIAIPALLILGAGLVMDGSGWPNNITFLPAVILLPMLWRWQESRRFLPGAPRRDELYYAVLFGSASAGIAAAMLWTICLLIHWGMPGWSVGKALLLGVVGLSGAAVVMAIGIGIVRHTMSALGWTREQLSRPVPLPRRPALHAAMGAVAGLSIPHLFITLVELPLILFGLPVAVPPAEMASDVAGLSGLPADPWIGYLLVLCGPPALAGASIALWATREPDRPS